MKQIFLQKHFSEQTSSKKFEKSFLAKTKKVAPPHTQFGGAARTFGKVSYILLLWILQFNKPLIFYKNEDVVFSAIIGVPKRHFVLET